MPTALAAPVEDGLSDQSSPCLTAHMMFCDAPRPPRQSLPDGPSTVFCVAVVACTVVMRAAQNESVRCGGVPCARARARLTLDDAELVVDDLGERGQALQSAHQHCTPHLRARRLTLVVHEALEKTSTLGS